MRLWFFLILSLSYYLAIAQYPHYDPLFYDHIHQSDEVIFYIDSAYQLRYTGNEWKINRKYVVSERNFFGQMIAADEFELNANNEYQYSKTWAATYSENGFLNYFLKEIWNPDSSSWVMNEKQVWNAEGLLNEFRVKDWIFEIPMACSGYGDLYQHNSDGQIIEELSLRWSLLEGWRNSERTIFTFDTVDAVTQHIYQKWDRDLNEWNNVTKWDYFYDGNINTYCFIYTWKTETEIWEKIWKRTHEFDENNWLVEVKYYRPLSDSTYQNHSRWSYNYNLMGREIEKIIERYDTVTQDWKSNDIYYTEYLNDSIISRYANIHWREDTGIWVNVFRRTWDYTEDLQLLYFLEEDGDWTGWKNDEQELFEYFDNYLLSYEKHQWKYDLNHEGYWSPNYREEYYWPDGVGNTSLDYKSDNLKIHPNPAKDQIQFELKVEKIISIVIFNSLGEKIEEIQILNDKYSLDISNLKTGLYFLRVKSKSGLFVKKFIKS